MPKHMCPCGDRLWTRDELIESGDEMARHIAYDYLTGDLPSGYCMDEDEIVPLGYAAEIIRRRALPEQPCPADCHPAFGCDACCAREVDAYLGGGRMTSPLSREANA